LPVFTYTYYFEYYFMVMYQYLGYKHQERNGYKVLTSVHLAMFLFLTVICVLGYQNGILMSSLYIYDDKTVIYKQLINGIIFVSAFLQVPLTFFQGKEFVLTLYDELRHESLSRKIRTLKTATSSDVYSQDNVRMVRK
jgi:hypothetical protein